MCLVRVTSLMLELKSGRPYLSWDFHSSSLSKLVVRVLRGFADRWFFRLWSGLLSFFLTTVARLLCGLPNRVMSLTLEFKAGRPFSSRNSALLLFLILVVQPLCGFSDWWFFADWIPGCCLFSWNRLLGFFVGCRLAVCRLCLFAVFVLR